MNAHDIAKWIDSTLNVKAYSDVSNNGLQIENSNQKISRVAFGVDGSVKFLEEAAKKGARWAVVHHGISWGGGIKTITGSSYNIINTAIKNDIALYAVHLPLDADSTLGHNWTIARELGLEDIAPAFSYHGVVIGATGNLKTGLTAQQFLDIVREKINPKASHYNLNPNAIVKKIGICSGGAGDFAADAKSIGCDVYLTGEADWGNVIDAENSNAPMITAGHFETEVFGLRELAKKMRADLGVETLCIF